MQNMCQLRESALAAQRAARQNDISAWTLAERGLQLGTYTHPLGDLPHMLLWRLSG